MQASVNLPSVINVLCTNNAPVVQLGELDGNGLPCIINTHTLHGGGHGDVSQGLHYV